MTARFEGSAEVIGDAERVDAGPMWLGRVLFGVTFQYSRIIPHSFVKLSPINQCNACQQVPEIAADNYGSLPILAQFRGGWAPL